jgi:hypothetical protein
VAETAHWINLYVAERCNVRVNNTAASYTVFNQTAQSIIHSHLSLLHVSTSARSSSRIYIQRHTNAPNSVKMCMSTIKIQYCQLELLKSSKYRSTTGYFTTLNNSIFLCRQALLLFFFCHLYSFLWVDIAIGYGLDGPGFESAPVRTGPGAHPASCKMDTGVTLSWRHVKLPRPSSVEVKVRVECFHEQNKKKN